MKSKILALVLGLFLTQAAFARPKYGPDAKPLSARTNQAYFQKNSAPDFWSLIPYYLPQETARGCSAANIAMLLNAARSKQALTSDDKLVTYKSFIEDYSGDKNYREAIEGKTLTTGTNFANTNLAKVLKNASDALKLTGPSTKVEFRQGTLAEFTKALRENEKTADDFIFFSFVQGTVTGDPEGGAHVATVAAFDAKKNLVLVLDPDRDWYEPYWTPAAKLHEAINDPKSDSEKKAGWIHFKVR